MISFLFLYCITNSFVKIVDMLNLSYCMVKQLNNIINDLPGSSHFQCRNLSVGNEPLEFYCRDILECIWSLYGDPQFAQDLTFTPEWHYTSQERTCCLYNKMFTGDWWWAIQVHNLCLKWYIIPNKYKGIPWVLSTRGHSDPSYHFIGQDAVNPILGQNGLPHLLNN